MSIEDRFSILIQRSNAETEPVPPLCDIEDDADTVPHMPAFTPLLPPNLDQE